MARANSPSSTGDLQDFWLEIHDIENTKDPETEDEDHAKTPDEGEQEAAWLQEAGFGFLVNKYQDGNELQDDEIQALTSLLPVQHAAVVRRRIDTLNATLRKKQKYTTKIDVRNIFPQQQQQQQGLAVHQSNNLDTSSTQAKQTSTVTVTRPTTLNTTSDLVWIKQISPRSPTTHKYVSNIMIETPRSPVSPREPVQPEWTNNRRTSAGKGKERPTSTSFLKNRGGYSMSGVTEEVQDNAQMGVETLSVQPKGTFLRSHSNPADNNNSEKNSPLSPISDADITFDINVEENQNSHNNEKKASIKTLHTEALPNFTLVSDKLGITYVRDLSDKDLVSVRSLALLELTSIFDSHSITYTRRRAKKKHKEHGLFGVSLQSLLENDQRWKENAKVPLIFYEIVSYLKKPDCLESEGILRVPGLISRIKQLRQELDDKFYHGSFVWGDDVMPNDVAGVMKQFLRELHSPLLTDEYIDSFAQVERLPDRKSQLHALNLLILLLPDVNRNTLNLLLEFLNLVVSRSSYNKMGLSNVAMIMAPNLFLAPNIRASQKGRSKVWELETQMAAGTSNIMRMLIKYHDILWTIPSYILAHVRRQYELEQIRRNRDKTKMKFLAKKDKTEVYKKPALIHESDFQEGVIRIQAPSLTKSSTAIQLDDVMTAGDIVSKFRAIQGSQTWDARKNAELKQSHGSVFSDPKNIMFAGEDTYLYEVGGNIVERCLPHKTNMMALYKVNPNAEWIIKRRRGSYS